MPTIVYLVHGMGCGTADGSAQPAGQRWTDSVLEAVNWVAMTYGIKRPAVLDPIPAQPPAGSDKSDSIWVVPVTYHEVFDEFRRGAVNRKAAVNGLAIENLVDGYVTALAGTDFAWVNCLDVLLWWADRAEARKRVTASILAQITRADDLAHKVPGATIRRILVSHSLGTATTTWALRHLGTNGVWGAIGGFEYWATLANVAPFLIETRDVYDPPLLPGRTGTIVRRMTNVRHEADPIPWLLPWRHWAPEHAGPAHSADWQLQATIGTLAMHETQGVAAPTGRKPVITDVHGFSNYLMSAAVSRELAGVIRGADFSDQEVAALSPAPATAWGNLPQLTCARTRNALANLRAATDTYVQVAGAPPGDPVEAMSGWLARLLRAAEILMAARDEC